MSAQHDKFAIIEQYCDNNGWDGFSIDRRKDIGDWTFEIAILFGRGVWGPTLTVTGHRVRWAASTSIPFNTFTNAEELSAAMERAFEKIKKAYDKPINRLARHYELK